MNWIASSHCASRAHCTECRNSADFRQSIVRAGLASEIDFDCPAGLPIGCGPITAPALPPGPGTILKKMLARLGLRVRPGCKCNQRAAQMDRLGPDWCERNIDTILDWLEEEAAPRRIPFSRTAARAVVRYAIRWSRSVQPKASPF